MIRHFLCLSLLVSFSANAATTCETLEDCQKVITDAKSKIREILDRDQIRITITDAIFTRDYSVPAMGEAYRDPLGLIWGGMVMNGIRPRAFNQYEAESYCKSIGARLPSNAEFRRLSVEYFGSAQNNGTGYNPYQKYKETKEDVLPYLSTSFFWTADIKPEDEAYGFVFKGYLPFGSLAPDFLRSKNWLEFGGGTRCVR